MSVYRNQSAPISEPLRAPTECTDDHILDGHHMWSHFYATKDGGIGRRCLRCPPKVRPSLFDGLEIDT